MWPPMPIRFTQTILNRWTPTTPVRAEFGRWVAYLSIDAAAVRAAAETHGDVPGVHARLLAGAPIADHDGSTCRLVSRSGA